MQYYNICKVNARGVFHKYVSDYFPYELKEIVWENEWDIAYPKVESYDGGVVVGTPEDYYGNKQGYRLVVAPVELNIDPLDYVNLEELRKEEEQL